MSLKLAQDLVLPVDAVTETFGIIAMRRVGKTYLASNMAEEFVANRQPFVALDPTGAWWGLRASADGLGPGLPVVILGGEHGDLPLEPGSGPMVAELVTEHPSYYICDFSLFHSGNDEARFATDFAERLYRLKGPASKHDPLHLFVDEADKFIPQQPMPDERRMLGAYDTLVRRGGIRGIGTTLITQRGAVINKNVWSQVGTMFVLRIMGEGDQEAVERWAKGHGTKDQVKDVLSTVGSMENGEGWVWSPVFLKRRDRHRFRVRRTFNSSATPKVGERRQEPKVFAPVELEGVRTRMAATIEKAKAEDPRALREKVFQLEDALRVAQSQLEDARRQTSFANEEDLRQLRVSAEGVRDATGDLERAAEAMVKLLPAIQEPSRRLLDTLQRLARAPIGGGESMASPTSGYAGRAADHVARPRDGYGSVGSAPNRGLQAAANNRMRAAMDRGGLSGMERAILTALAQYQGQRPEGMEKGAVLLHADYAQGGATSRCFASLTERGWVELPSPGLLRITKAGLRALGEYEPLPTGAAHRARIVATGGMESKIMATLFSHYPHAVPKGTILQQAGYAQGGATSRMFSRLVRMGWARPGGAGRLKASEEFYR